LVSSRPFGLGEADVDVFGRALFADFRAGAAPEPKVSALRLPTDLADCGVAVVICELC
jgi:hypothetical protein